MNVATWIPTALVVAALVGFALLDKTTLHWYSPDLDRVESSANTTSRAVERVEARASDLEQNLSSLQTRVSDNNSSLNGGLEAFGRDSRIANAVTVLSLISAYGGFQSTASAAGEACRDWLMFGIGSITDCGFRHVDP